MSRERSVNIGLGTTVALLAALGAVWRRSATLLVVAAAAATGELVYRRWLSRSSSEIASRIRSGANASEPATRP